MRQKIVAEKGYNQGLTFNTGGARSDADTSIYFDFVKYQVAIYFQANLCYNEIGKGNTRR